MAAGCADAPASIAPQGPMAGEIARLWWILLGLGGAVYLAVMAFLGLALWRRRRAGQVSNAGGRRDGSIILLGGIVMPAVVLLVVLGVTISTLLAVAAPPLRDDLTVHVIGRQWWWEVHYPNQQVTTANEIHIPVGVPVHFELSSQDVIHSFWVPELAGKLDMIPGQTNRFWLQADRAGEYTGLCAEFCGIQHAKMLLTVVAMPEAEFTAWVEQQRQPVTVPSGELAARGEQVFLDSGCAHCHTIRGTNATGDLGPDLTHLASRRTLGAGIVANNLGTLSGWVVDPQRIKPGNLMPATPMAGDELHALLAYLSSLE
jgi:cytochrome c oxidase subunit II